jgi:Carbohydrate/starch-binding module (family 21)
MSLRLSLDNLKPQNVFLNSHDSHPAEASTQGAKSASRESSREGRLVRKKSGQLVKSSLKPSKSATRNTLSIVTVPQSSKSEPTTPTNKAVHFDSQLEHVKLFLAEQKPLAVSRDGSPTDDTSGTDSDFPNFIYGESDDRRPRKKIFMQLGNMPSTINSNLDVTLEDLSLTPDGTSILGRVRVRNLAFAKWVAIRFTFDSWQTTSEVTGRYVQPIDSEFDRFSFTIRLNDILARIEDKTMVMAIRYSVAGRDIWDNNNGQNYLATFTKSKAEGTRLTTLSDEEASADMDDLRSKLEKVSQSDDRTGPAFLAQHSRQKAGPADPETTCFRTTASFGSRYNFDASLKSPWDSCNSPPSHARNQSFPVTGSRTSLSSIPWPQRGSADAYSPRPSPVPGKSNMGLPRDIRDDTFTPDHRRQDDIHIRPYTPRNHRRGYFDLTHTNGPHSAALRWTPPGTPTETPTSNIQNVSSDSGTFSPPMRFSSLSPMDNSPRSMPPLNSDNPGDMGGDSELSTPSLFTPSSSRSSTPSPTEMFMSPLAYESPQSLSPDTHYRQFINKHVFLFMIFCSTCAHFFAPSFRFCFFTGQGTFLDESSVDLLPRTQSASDIEEFLSGLSPRLPFPTLSSNDFSPTISTSVSPTRSSSLDDLTMNRSGSLTPTLSRLALTSTSAISASVSAQSRNMTSIPSWLGWIDDIYF